MDKPTIKTQSTELSNDINVITAEINAYKRVAGEAIFEIGRRLKHVKENDLSHGQWLEWLRSIDFDEYQASRFIKVYNELSDSSLRTCANIGFRVLYEIATLPPEEREKPHVIPSTGEVKTVDEMTVRELREVKAALKEAEKARAEAEKRAKQAEKVAAELVETNHALKDTIESLSNQPPRVEYAPDPETEAKLNKYREVFGDIDDNVYRITNLTEINGAALKFSEAVRNLLQEFGHLAHYSAEFIAINKFSAREYQSALEGLKQFINDMERNLAYKNTEEAVIIDITQ